MKPTKLVFWSAIAWGLLGLAASFGEGFAKPWLGLGGVAAAVMLLDMIWLAARKPPRAERKLPGRFALGEYQDVEVVLHNPRRHRVRVMMFDGIPPEAETEHLPWEGEVPADSFTRVIYQARMMKRGKVHFTPVQLLEESPLRFWQRKAVAAETAEVRVYPNYEPIIQFALLALMHRESQMGIVKRNWVGMSREFHQLREYHESDVLSQVDWKATAKRHQLISREYQEQRDQNIILMVDSGRRMRAMDGALSQFDHCLNAMLLLSYFALRQGDHVGVLGFGGTKRWLPPVKGQHSMPVILNHLYDFETSTDPSDFREAAEMLAARQKRRALVILLTNLRSEDNSLILPALKLIRRRHLVLLASLREKTLEEGLKRPVNTHEDALKHGATHLYFEERRQLIEQIAAFGVSMVDTTPQNLPITLTNRYFEIKRSGML